MTRWGSMAVIVFAAAAAAAQTGQRPAAVRVPAAAPVAPAAPAPVAAAEPVPGIPDGTTEDVPNFGDLTVITADKLVYDGRNHFAELTGHVVVSDPQLKMKSDTVRIDMEGTNQVKTIVATGHVVLTQSDKQAWAGRATYDVPAGKYVLEENPRVMRGRDMMLGDRITFWRDQERMECYPNARLIIQPESARKPGGVGGVR